MSFDHPWQGGHAASHAVERPAELWHWPGGARCTGRVVAGRPA